MGTLTCCGADGSLKMRACSRRVSGGREPYTTQHERPAACSTRCFSEKISRREKATTQSPGRTCEQR